MPTGKRASMREGPLADLFRKTAEDQPARPEREPDDAQPPLPGPAQDPPPSANQAPPPPAQRTPAPPPPAPPPPAQRTPAPPPPAQRTPAELGPAPAVDESARSEDRLEPGRLPTPKERLRHAFSADIPINMLDRPAPPPEPDDAFARPQRYADAFAAPPPQAISQPVLRVVGVGGAGVNAVNRMVEAEIAGVEFLAINTDLQSLQTSAADDTLHIGGELTRGLGSGSDPELGRRAARDAYDRIKAMLRGCDMVFIAAGAGGGTGTGAAPIVAEIAAELGALTVGIVTRPFQFEGSRRREQADVGIAELAEKVDTLIVVPNNRLLSVLDKNVSMVDAFKVADDVLRQGVQGISDLVTLPGLINLDFADVRTIMSGAGSALLGIGMGTGERRALDAAERAVSSPLLEMSMDGARSILLSITGGADLSLWEVNESAKAVAQAAHPDANIIFGAMIDEMLSDQVWVTVVATGFGDGRPRGHAEGSPGARTERDRQDRDALREPRGEPRVTRVRERSSASSERRPGELDVPEFIPRR